jgi:hypothetical protein
MTAPEGVIYLVSGPRSYLGELRTSVLSLRRHEPDLPVTVFSTYGIRRDLRVDHVPYDNELHPLQQKVDVLARSPYERTLFLDTDTTVLGPIRPVFGYLDANGFAVAHASLADYSVRPPKLSAMVDPTQYNTGVLCFDDSPGTTRLLERWKAAVLEQDPTDMWPGHHCDQTYFNQLIADGAVADCGVAFTSIPNTVYNVRGLMIDEMKGQGIWDDARILHHRTSAMKARKLAYSLTDMSAANEALRRGGVAVRQKLRRLSGRGVSS